VANACKFDSENRTEFSLRAPVIAWLELTRGLGADATTSSSSAEPPNGFPPPPNGLAASVWAKRSAPASAVGGELGAAATVAGSANGSSAACCSIDIEVDIDSAEAPGFMMA
jgi:hypothetical protein